MELIKNKLLVSQEILGGKAMNLMHLEKVSQMQGINFKVPKWQVVTWEQLNSLLPKELQKETDFELVSSFVNQLEIPIEVIAEIKRNFNILNEQSGNWFAVRSSALDEDGTNFSFAGQFESYLFVAPEQLGEYIKKVWLSAFSKRVQSYRAENGLPPQVKISVIIQEMVDS
ncbi:MAG: phosphoenolpyruvate synthase, partial [Bacteroidia bacterium]|nr:phosphoenolpyruvate synthase [Bacteroidia bacterium]